jgi:selenocysteine-specific elongation factor
VERVEVVRTLLERTTLAGSPILLVSARTGEGLDRLRDELVALVDRAPALLADWRRAAGDKARLAVDRVFAVKGRGAVVTGSLRGGSVATGATLRTEPAGHEVRVREIQVHGRTVDRADGGRTALDLVGATVADLRRGLVLTADARVGAADRLLVALRPSVDLAHRSVRERDAPWPQVGARLRIHLGTDQADVLVQRVPGSAVTSAGGETVVLLKLDRALAAGPDDGFVLRRPSPGSTIGGGRILDPRPPSGPSRRRMTPERLTALVDAGDDGARAVAVLELHGGLPAARWSAMTGRGREAPTDRSPVARLGPMVLAEDVEAGLVEATLATVTAHHEADPDSSGVPVSSLRTAVALGLRRRVAAAPPDASGAATALLDRLIADGRLAREGDRVRDAGRTAGPPPALESAMGRLEAALSTPSPPAFSEAVRVSGCAAEGVRALESSGRIVRLEPELAFSAATYRDLARRALAMARTAPLTPAAFRDATGSSRKYALAILEDLGRRAVLSRTPDGHVPGPRAGLLEDDPA